DAAPAFPPRLDAGRSGAVLDPYRWMAGGGGQRARRSQRGADQAMSAAITDIAAPGRTSGPDGLTSVATTAINAPTAISQRPRPLARTAWSQAPIATSVTPSPAARRVASVSGGMPVVSRLAAVAPVAPEASNVADTAAWLGPRTARPIPTQPSVAARAAASSSVMRSGRWAGGMRASCTPAPVARKAGAYHRDVLD